MAAAQHEIEIKGRLFGHAISVDARYVFYAAEGKLRHLDDRRFDSVEEVKLAVIRALVRAPMTGHLQA